METTVYRLSEICKIKSGKRLPLGMDLSTESTPYMYIRARDIKGGRIITDDVAFIDSNVKEQINKYIIETGDIALTIVANIGDVGYCGDAANGANLTENAIRLTSFNKKKVDSKYLTYYFSMPFMKKYMEALAAGAAQAKLGIYKIEKMKAELPRIETQKIIVEILSAYDELIEKNNRKIAILQEQAQELYKEWFVRFRFPGYETAKFENGLPEGWKYTTVEALSDILRRGISPVYDDNGKYAVISQKCIREKIMDISESRMQTKEFSSEINLIDSDTIICSTGTGTLGRVGQVYGDYPNTTFDSHVTLVRAKQGFGKQYLFFTLSNMQVWFMNMGIGSTNQQELYRGTIKNAKVLLPSKELIRKFDVLVEQLHREVTVLGKKRDNLVEQRDLLLPRLMSGKLEVQ